MGLGRVINGAAAILTPAGTGGVTVTLTSNPIGVVTLAPSTVTIDPGATSAPFTITGAAVGTTTITGTATGFGPSTVDITVTIGSGRPGGGGARRRDHGDPDQRRLEQASAVLQRHGGRDRAAHCAGDRGNTASPTIFIQALDSTSSVIVTMTASGFQTSTSTMTLAPSGFIINTPGNFNTTTLSNPTTIQHHHPGGP